MLPRWFGCSDHGLYCLNDIGMIHMFNVFI